MGILSFFLLVCLFVSFADDVIKVEGDGGAIQVSCTRGSVEHVGERRVQDSSSYSAADHSC